VPLKKAAGDEQRAVTDDGVANIVDSLSLSLSLSLEGNDGLGDDEVAIDAVELRRAKQPGAERKHDNAPSKKASGSIFSPTATAVSVLGAASFFDDIKGSDIPLISPREKQSRRAELDRFSVPEMMLDEDLEAAVIDFVEEAAEEEVQERLAEEAFSSVCLHRFDNAGWEEMRKKALGFFARENRFAGIPKEKTSEWLRLMEKLEAVSLRRQICVDVVRKRLGKVGSSNIVANDQALLVCALLADARALAFRYWAPEWDTNKDDGYVDIDNRTMIIDLVMKMSKFTTTDPKKLVFPGFNLLGVSDEGFLQHFTDNEKTELAECCRLLIEILVSSPLCFRGCNVVAIQLWGEKVTSVANRMHDIKSTKSVELCKVIPFFFIFFFISLLFI
jgi:hypothetical protein